METYTEDQLAAEFGVTPRQVKNYAATIAEIDGIAPTGRRRHSAAARQKMLQLRELGGPIAYKKWVQAQLPIAPTAPQPITQPTPQPQNLSRAVSVSIVPTPTRWVLRDDRPTELQLAEPIAQPQPIAPMSVIQQQLLDLAAAAQSGAAAANMIADAMEDRLLQGIDHTYRMGDAVRGSVSRLEDRVIRIEALAAEQSRLNIREAARVQVSEMEVGKLNQRYAAAAASLGYVQSPESQPV